jgi:hypothetical protein
MRLLLLVMLIAGAAAADPYDAWVQGRPAEALAPLIAAAQASGRWDAWLDAGLAAAAADQRGEALACLAQAHRRAPERSEPLNAMRALGAAVPTTWCERAGPLAIPGAGWTGIIVLLATGVCLGAGGARGRARWPLLAGGTLLLFIALPGAVAPHIDRAAGLCATVRDTAVMDSAGVPGRALPAGSLVRRTGSAWADRSLVQLPDGSHGWLADSDLRPGASLLSAGR